MLNQTNDRTFKTKRRLQQALMTQLQQQSFQQVTVGDILATAQVARGTFYRYYLDKFDLLAACEDQLIQTLTAIFAKFSKPKLTALSADEQDNAFYAMLVYLDAQRTTVTSLMRCPASALLLKMHDVIATLVVMDTAEQTNVVAPDQLIIGTLAQELIIQNIITILSYWLQQPEPVDVLTAYRVFLRSRSLSPQDLATIVAWQRVNHHKSKPI
jgi:AcrR family transcriptional regulator